MNDNLPFLGDSQGPGDWRINCFCLHWAFLNSQPLGYVLPSFPQSGKFSRVHGLLQSAQKK